MTWYKDGLVFGCTSCGQCCTGAPGYVWLEQEDIQRLAKHLELSESDFLRRYTRFVRGRYSLTELKPHYDCVFLKEKKCTVYHARPSQCKKFPWWPQNLTSKKAWDEAALHCEGINANEGKRFTPEEIQKQLDD